MLSDNKKFQAAGLKIRKNKDGSLRLYWCARSDLVKKGYQPETVRLSYDLGDSSHHALITAACLRLQAEMLEWSRGYRRETQSFNGTLGGLVLAYQTDPASPYVDLKHNTRRTYNQLMDKIEKAFGQRALAALTISDFRRWYDEAKKPRGTGGPERVTKAHNIMRMLRRLLSYGVMTELAECERLHRIMDQARFKQPARRRVKLELQHVQSFIVEARAAGRISLALGTAVQFETGMRQRDVIGEWNPIAQGTSPSGVVLQGRRWMNGLTWTDLADGMVIRKVTTKTGAIVSHDLSLSPLVLEVLNWIAPEKRIGPLIIDEIAGRPYAEHAYAREWRAIARKAGIPDHIKNMDARAGAITEAEDAGASLDDIRGAVGHTQISTTARYSRGALGKSQSVAMKRNAHRTAKEQE